MPANNPDTTATLEITIQSKDFTVPHRYVAGDCTLTEGEAHALQQVYAENIRNNFAGQMKRAAEETPPRELGQTDLDAYVAGYEFGVRSGGGGVARNPVEAEERRLIIAKLREALTAKGKSWRGLTEEQQDMLVTRAIEGGQFRAQAEQVVAAKKAAKEAASALSIEIE
jgi:hypothetical protein